MPGITTSRIVLGDELVRFRKAAKVSRKAAAVAATCSESHISHLESGRNAPTDEAQLIKLARLYKIPTETLDRLRRLWVDASKPGWWSIYGLPTDYARYVGLETDAERLLTWSTLNIHGLLQTERYMRHKFSLEARLSSRAIDKLVLTRLNRQHRISGGDDPLKLVAVISEAAIVQCAHTPLVGPGQLHQLIQRASLPNVELHVLPLKRGMHAGQDGAFAILSFPDQLLPDVVYQEHSAGSEQTDVPSIVKRLDTRHGELRSQALDANESLTWLTQLADETTAQKGS